MYQRTNIVVLDHRKPQTCYSLGNDTMFLHLSGHPQSLGPIAAPMAATTIDTPMCVPSAVRLQALKGSSLLLSVC